MTLADNQHLEFLISQYVDDSLDTADRKLVEQQITTDPVARTLYKDHRDTQDLLEEFGGRIPLINWQEFDEKLSVRLADEAATMKIRPQVSVWRRWVRPAAIAAGLMLAAGIGYGWHAFTQPLTPTQVIIVNSNDSRPVKNVQLTDQPVMTAARKSVQVNEVPADAVAASAAVKIQDSAVGESQVAQSNQDSQNLIGNKTNNAQSSGSVTAGAPEITGDVQVENLR